MAFNSKKCRKEIRLVAQPLIIQTEGFGQGALYHINSAIHLIYELNDQEFEAATKKILEFRQNGGSAGERLFLTDNDEFIKNYTDFIFLNCPEKNLLRVAITLEGDASLNGEDLSSRGFAMFSRDASGRFTPNTIPTLTATAQYVYQTETYRYEFIPEPNRSIINDSSKPFFDNLEKILSVVSGDNYDDTPLVEEAILRSYRVDNPNIHHFDSLDCISCHLPSWHRALIEDGLGPIRTDESTHFNLARYGTREHEMLRNFLLLSTQHLGYSDAVNSFSFRAFNESAAVAEQMTQQYRQLLIDYIK